MSSNDERQTVLHDLHALIDAFFPTTRQVAATPGNAEAARAPVMTQKTLVDFFGGLKRKKEAPEEKKHVCFSFISFPYC